MSSTPSKSVILHLGLALAAVVGLLFMHGLMVPGSSMAGHGGAAHAVTSSAPGPDLRSHFGSQDQSSNAMHVLELCVLILASGIGLAALARSVPRGTLDSRALPVTGEKHRRVTHGPGPPICPSHLELGIVLR